MTTLYFYPLASRPYPKSFSILTRNIGVFGSSASGDDDMLGGYFLGFSSFRRRFDAVMVDEFTVGVQVLDTIVL